LEATHVIHDLSAAGDGGASCLSLVRINGKEGVWLLPENPLNHRNNSLDFLVSSDACLLTTPGYRDPGTGGLAAEVDDVCALGEKPESVLHSRVARGELAAIGERVGCHIYHTHDQRAVPQSEGLATEVPVIALAHGADSTHARSGKRTVYK
jgi:hypothetical protein